MGFLNLPDAGIDMSKATISFWFRVPQATVDKVTNLELPGNGAYGYSFAATWPVLQWQLTLLSWADQIQGTIYWMTQQKVGETQDLSGDKLYDNYAPFPTETQTGSMAPCYIGLDFKGFDQGEPVSPVRLVVNLQSNQQPSIQNVTFTMTEWNVIFIGTPGVSGFLKTTIFNTDISYMNKFPLTIGAASGPAGPDIAADVWHHLLISWDVTGTISCGGNSTAIDSKLRMYLALDDQNYDKGGLPARWIGDIGRTDFMPPGSAGTEPHTIVTNDEDFHRLPWPAVPGQHEFSSESNDMPAGSFSGEMGKLLAKKLFVPGSPDYTDDGRTANSVYNIEMAELQIFAGLMLDTSNEANRRAFIDFERDEAGNPVVDKAGKMELKPVKPKTTEQLLGRRPDVLLHGTKNWQQGKNTGSTGLERNTDDGDDEIPSGQFAPTGTIEKYTPDPSITK